MFYSVIVRFRAKKDIYFNYYPGESLHGMLFHMINKRDEEKVTVLHDRYNSKPFTISPILPYLKWRKGKRYLKKGKKYFFRITFLEEEWYKLFMEYFLYHPEGLKLNGVKIEVIEALTNSKQDNRCDCIEPSQLRQNSGDDRKIKFKFHSTTTFSIEDRHIIFPRADYLFNSLFSKWQEFGSEKLTVEREDFDNIYLSRYDLESTMEWFNDYPIKGFEGKCKYELSSKISSKKVKDINLLAGFAFYGGVGYKTTMGLGQVARMQN
ncbi:CRISPR-associated endoribonuclease Cas6 [Acetohalobium arabaticum]|uniref:CRISPR-associated protein Cas6 n=1 Tax=Acetohalobium arabaticum (strain ATCC 49924 / DSM 5501 / Z-7288) TaxID=574087 RepID=D9QVV0_ACEAZ|nr:CRISPR-associated endoribonuclease Cas6 [Acetohalobium arabaticum]ADL12359.1 CRISPR-associated protein Cas6 [Acetohalobium arabaticum DSM 5501]